jgi:hypothetical protein
LRAFVASINFSSALLDGVLAFLLFAGATDYEVFDRRQRPNGPIAKSAAVIASLFSPCHLLLEKFSKSLIPHRNCPFFPQ